MTPTPPRPNASGRIVQPQHSRGGWVIPLAFLGLLVLGASLWLGLRQRSGSAAARPISALGTRDFHSLVWSVTEPNTVFFGHHQGLLKSTDGGRRWQPTSLDPVDTMELAASPQAPLRMYAAGHGIFRRSDDGGKTWTAPETAEQGADLHGFAQSPLNPDTLYAVDMGQGLVTSADGGATWKLVSASPPGQALAFRADGKTLLTGTATGVEQSTDGGTTWTPLGRGISTEAAVFGLAVSPNGETTLAATTVGVYRLSGAGGTWTLTNLRGTVLAIAISPLQPNVVLAVDQRGGVYRSEDGGTTW